MFVEQRARVLEAIAAVAKATGLQEPFSPALAAATKSARDYGRAELAEVFATEIAGLDADSRLHALDACDALTTSDTWEYLRVRRGLPPDEAAATLSTSLRRLLRPEVTTPIRQRARRWRTRPPATPASSGGEEHR